MTESLADPKRGRGYQHQPQSIKLRQALDVVKPTKSTTQEIRASSVSNRALGSMTEYIILPRGLASCLQSTHVETFTFQYLYQDELESTNHEAFTCISCRPGNINRCICLGPWLGGGYGNWPSCAVCCVTPCAPGIKF
jgi:hypothetical protein